MRKILDERERLQRQQHIRLIVTETLMFLAVLVLVGFLTLVVMGYSFNLRGLDGSGDVVERTGLVQVSSQPTGATIYIDGETGLLFNTNASRATLAGEHEISLARGGYDGWKKTINVTEGMMYRLNYPRLFKEEREAEVAMEFGKGVSFVTVSPNNERMVVLIDGKIFVVSLNENTLTRKELELLDVEGNVVKVTTFTSAEWSGNSERILAKVNGKWAAVNVRDVKATMWLEEAAGMNEKEMRDLSFATETGERVLMVNERKELVEWSVREKKLSEALVANVEKFDNDGERVVFLTKAIVDVDEGVEVRWQVRGWSVGGNESYAIATLGSTETAKVADIYIKTMRYFQESYVAVASGETAKIYKKNGWVAADGEMEGVEVELGKRVVGAKKRGKGMVFEFAFGEGDVAVYDIEALKLVPVNTTGCGWVDEYLRYRLTDGKLSVLDYDGLNERVLVESGVESGRVVAISGNNRWLYYFTKSKEGVAEELARERIN